MHQPPLHQPPLHQPPRLHRYTAQLDLEWEHLRHRRRQLDHARRWRPSLTAGRLADALGELHDLDQIVAATDDRAGDRASDRASDRAGDGSTQDSGDLALLHLVELARNDQLAGRIVIQRILPGLVIRSARYRSRRDDVDPAEIVVAAAWIAVGRYDTTRRRRHVAASLISDSTFQAFRQPLRRRSATEHVVAAVDFERTSAPSESVTDLEQLAEVVRTARSNGVPAADLQLIRELVQVGSPGVLAAQRGVTPRTIRNHRDRAVAHIRDALAVA